MGLAVNDTPSRTLCVDDAVTDLSTSKSTVSIYIPQPPSDYPPSLLCSRPSFPVGSYDGHGACVGSSRWGKGKAVKKTCRIRGLCLGETDTDTAECAQCGYPAAKLRSYNWGLKAKRRKTTYVEPALTSHRGPLTDRIFLLSNIPPLSEYPYTTTLISFNSTAVPAECPTSRMSTDDSRTVSERVLPLPRRPRLSLLKRMK